MATAETTSHGQSTTIPHHFFRHFAEPSIIEMKAQEALRQPVQGKRLEDRNARSRRAKEQAERYRDHILASGRARYPLLPPGFPNHPRFYILGWKVTEEWQDDFVREHRPDYSAHSKYLICIALLRRLSGYQHIFYFPVIPNGGEILPDGSTQEEKFDWVIAISATASKKYFLRRPLQKQFDWFNQVFGTPARWYMDLYPKERFGEHYIS